MAVVPRKRKGKTVYGVLTSYKKDGEPRTSWKLLSTNKREAQEYDRACRKAVNAGTYKPEGELTDAASFDAYSRQWNDKRTNRAAENEWTFVRIHVLGDPKRGTEGRPWFAKKRMGDFRPKHFIQLAKELTEAGGLSDKSISNLMGTLSVIFRDATIEEVISVNPYIMPRGVLKRSGKKREPYEVSEANDLTCMAGAVPQCIWNAIAFYTGARCGEVCGLRWGDWNEAPTPLGALSIERQYEGLPLKTDRPRVVPVHPKLAWFLKAWKDAWSQHYLRQPGPDDLIVPQQDGTARTRASAYKAWRKGCEVAGVTNRSVHSTRHTFITLALRGGAVEKTLNRITHNPKGDIMDVYNTRGWADFCAAVMCLNLDGVLDADGSASGITGSDSRTRTSATEPKTVDSRDSVRSKELLEIEFPLGIRKVDPVLDARRDNDSPSIPKRHGLPGRPPGQPGLAHGGLAASRAPGENLSEEVAAGSTPVAGTTSTGWLGPLPPPSEPGEFGWMRDEWGGR